MGQINCKNLVAAVDTSALVTYTLSLSPDYVLTWGFWEAIRELLQNSIDRQAFDPSSEKIFDYTESVLTIGNTNCSLEPKTLLLGASDKRGSHDMIGEFGEGYKLALLVLTRLSWKVVILNNNTVWVPKFEYSDEYQEYVLAISVYQAETAINGVQFVICDVSRDNFGDVAENYLGDVETNQILEEKHLRKRVFVSGLFICEIDELKYGYNFSPDRIKLDRDRRLASSFEVTFEASQLWKNCGNDALLYDNMKEGIPDVQHISFSPGRTSEYIVNQFLTEHPGSLPVSSQDEIDKFRGCKTRLVPAPLRNLLRDMHAFVFNREGTPSERLEGFRRRFGNQLSKEGKRELRAILEESADWV